MILDTLQMHNEIEELVRESGTDYIDAVLHYCKTYDLEPETIGAIIAKDQTLTEKIQIEAENLHFIKRISTLPI